MADVAHDGGAGVHGMAVAGLLDPLEVQAEGVGVEEGVGAGSGGMNTPEDLAAARGEHPFAELVEGVVAAAESAAGHMKSYSVSKRVSTIGCGHATSGRSSMSVLASVCDWSVARH